MQHKKRHSRKTVKLMEERSQKASTVWSSRGRWQNTKRQDSITYCRNFPRPQERQESSVYKQSSSSEQTFKKYDKDKEHSSKFSERKKKYVQKNKNQIGIGFLIGNIEYKKTNPYFQRDEGQRYFIQNSIAKSPTSNQLSIYKSTRKP